MARANQGRWLFLWLAAAGCICIHPLPATAEEDCPPYLGPEVPILSHADSLALLIDVPARLTHAQRQLDECRALSRSGRFLDAQCSVERLMASLHELRQQVSMSYAENQKLIDLVRMAGGVRLNCVRQHLSVRPSFHPSDPDADESGDGEAPESPPPPALTPTDSMLAGPAAQEILPEDNDRVQKWIDFFTGRGRPTFSAWLKRSGEYTQMMVPILERNGLPVDLIHLVFVESGFNPLAFSRSAASGP